MAFTVKNLEIRNQKERLLLEALDVILQARELSAKVPRAVIVGDARLAVTWRDAAEKMHHEATVPPLSLSLSKIHDRVEDLKNMLSVIRNPS